MNDKTLFERKVVPAAPKSKKITSSNRKTRSDKKNDIKPMITPDQKKKLSLRALDEKVSLTEFCSKVVKDYLEKGLDYGDYDYPSDGKFVHVMLEQEYFKQIQLLHIEWDLSLRKVVHRIICEYLHREFDGVEVLDWRDN